MQSKLPRDIRNVVEDVCLDPNAKTNHMMMSPAVRKRQEELAKNGYRDMNTTSKKKSRLGNRIENAIERESEIEPQQEPGMDYPVVQN